MSSVWTFAQSAIFAGYSARAANLRVSTVTTERRNARVLIPDGKKNEDPVTADRWIFSIGEHCKYGKFWEDEALGAGTPLVCLYFLGWVVGKSWFGLVIAQIPILLVWVYFFALSRGEEVGSAENGVDSAEKGVDVAEKGVDFAEKGVPLLAMVLLTFFLFYGRVAKRTPENFPKSASFWVGIFLETLLANTLTCASHVLGDIMDKSGMFSAGGGWSLVIGVTTFVSPIVSWISILKAAQNRQDAYIKDNHLAAGLRSDRDDCENDANLTTNLSSTTRESIRDLMRALIERSGDLRMTGLSTPELEKLALRLKGVEADGIRFFTRGGRSEREYNRFIAFHQGYMFYLTRGEASDDSVVAWIRKWRQDKVNGDPLAAIRSLANSTEEPTCYAALKRLINIRLSVNSSDTEGLKTHLWWLCGAIATACDISIAEASNSSGTNRCHAYALVLSALNVDRNSLAAILAMMIDKKTAQNMKEKMERGCEEVLKRVSNEVNFYEGRGLIVTTADEKSTPVVTYSAAGAWQAEKSREAVVLGAHAFNRLWKASIKPSNDLTLNDKTEVWKNSVEWSKKMEVLVDYTRILRFLWLEGSALLRVQATARQGWFMHSLWVVLAIGIRILLPEHLFEMAVGSSVILRVAYAEQYAHVVYMGFQLWRSPIGKILTYFPLMSDADMDSIAWYCFGLAVLVVNWGSTFLGMSYNHQWEKVAYWFILLGSIAPGLWYFLWIECGNTKAGPAVVKYVGRKRGAGYEHRDPKNPGCFRPLGRDILKDDEMSVTKGNALSVPNSDGVKTAPTSGTSNYEPCEE